MVSFYQLALNEYNKGQPSYCNPRKGTADYLAVKQYADELKIAKNLKKKTPAEPKAVSAPAPKPKSAPKPAKAKAVPKSDTKDMPKPKSAPIPKPKTSTSSYMDYLNTIMKKHTGPEKQYIEKTIDLVNKTDLLMSKGKAMPYKLIVDLDKLRNSVITAEKYASMTKNTLSDTILLEQILAVVKYRNKYTENDTLESLTEIQRDNIEITKEKLQQFLDEPISKGATKWLFKSRLENMYNSWLRNSIPKHLKKDLLLLLQKVAMKYKYKDMVKSIEAYLNGDLIFI